MKKKCLCPLFLCLLLTIGLLTACSPRSETGEPGSISGRVYFDEDADQQCAECECGIPEANVTLYANACGGTMVRMLKTDTEGYFTFENVAPGNYCVFSGLTTSCEGYLPTTSLSQTIALAPGEQLELEWFGYDLYINSLTGED